jgi:Domain of unknown function (DUF5615)
MARIYANENFYRQSVVKLRELGHDVLTSFEAGRANQKIPDEEVLGFAIEEKRCMLTLNRRHFGKLHLLDANHFGIISCTEDSDFEDLANRINDAIVAEKEDLVGKLIKIYRPN